LLRKTRVFFDELPNRSRGGYPDRITILAWKSAKYLCPMPSFSKVVIAFRTRDRGSAFGFGAQPGGYRGCGRRLALRDESATRFDLGAGLHQYRFVTCLTVFDSNIPSSADMVGR